MTKANLLVIQGIDQGARFELGDKPLGIGRGVHNQIRILDTEVSRQHAMVRMKDGKYSIVDRNSSNGTFVNGVGIRSHALQSGDQIQIGRSVMLFTQAPDGSDSEHAAESIDFISLHAIDEQASIVGKIKHDPGETLLGSPFADETIPRAQSMLNLQALYRVTEEVVSPTSSPEQLLRKILDLTIDAVKADRGCILLADPETDAITPQVYASRLQKAPTTKMPISRSIVDYVLKNGQGVRTSDARRDARFADGQSILQAGIREALCVPMQGRYQLIGVVYVDTTVPSDQMLLSESPSNQFGEDQLRLLVAIGRQAALAVENQRYQQALVKAERLAAMGQTIAMLSHHIKNILQGVRGGSYLIDLGLKDHKEDMVRKGWGIVDRNQNKIYHLVMDMLSFSKDRKPALSLADLNETVQDIFELMKSRADEVQVSLEFRPDESMPETLFDPEGIHRAILNIVINALDAVEGIEGGAVLIQTGYDNKSDVFFVTIADNGPGIPPEQLQKIFNIFESTKGARGTGLGLAVSQKILREHGGEIHVQSRVGEGSQFVLSWPSIDEEQAQHEGLTRSGH